MSDIAWLSIFSYLYVIYYRKRRTHEEVVDTVPGDGDAALRYY